MQQTAKQSNRTDRIFCLPLLRVLGGVLRIWQDLLSLQAKVYLTGLITLAAFDVIANMKFKREYVLSSTSVLHINVI